MLGTRDGKHYRYKVVEILFRTTSRTSPAVGDVLLYPTGRGPIHRQVVVNSKTGKIVEQWVMESIGPCWVKDGKVIKVVDRNPRKR